MINLLKISDLSKINTYSSDDYYFLHLKNKINSLYSAVIKIENIIDDIFLNSTLQQVNFNNSKISFEDDIVLKDLIFYDSFFNVPFSK